MAAAHLQQALVLVAGDTALAGPIHLALAKLYEHRLGSLERALEHARKAATCEKPAASQRRVGRLCRRLGQQAAC